MRWEAVQGLKPRRWLTVRLNAGRLVLKVFCPASVQVCRRSAHALLLRLPASRVVRKEVVEGEELLWLGLLHRLLSKHLLGLTTGLSV